MISKLKFEYKITILYLAIGGLWIVFSDKLVDYSIQDKESLTQLQTFKGWFYVVFTAVLLFLFLRKHLVKLRAAQKKAEENDMLKTAFLHNISHEIRTPLNAVVGFADLLNDPELSLEKRQEFTKIIVERSDQLLSIITDIVNIAIIESGQEKVVEKEVNLNDLFINIYNLFSPIAEQHNIIFDKSCRLNDQDALINVDQVKLLAILSNLIGNALKFTRQGHVNFGCTKKGNTLEFYVEDTGIGISPDMFEVVFDRFLQIERTPERQFGGSGLGLSIAKAYVEMLGGKIWLKSELGKGSVFYFTLPYKKVEGDSFEKQVCFDNRQKPAMQKVIMIAEDEDLNFILLNEMLLNSNFTLLRALNGLEAVEMCKSDQRVDLILMDLKMPVMNGFEATQRIKKIRPNLPVIAQTAYSTDIDKAKAIASGCSDYISKPIKQDLLISKINSLLL